VPIHDWARVNVGIFHAFQHAWITDLSRALNQGELPVDYYALPERHTAGLQADRPPLERPAIEAGDEHDTSIGVATAASDMEFYRCRQTPVVIRRAEGDGMVAMIKIVSPAIKAARPAFQSFIKEAADLIARRVHLLIVDILPPGPHDPHGVHAAIWQEVVRQDSNAAAGRSPAVSAYEAGPAVGAYVEPLSIGRPLPDMPLFLEPRIFVHMPLDATYESAFGALPRRWRWVLDSKI
jgi:hypothetical protein